MRTLPTVLRRIVPLLVVALALASGCDEEITIHQTPAFYNPQIKTIAILPFRNESSAKSMNPGNIIADKLAAALRANGTYRVYSRNELKTLMDEADLQAALSGNPSATDFSRMMNVDAVLTGAVTTYAATSANRSVQKPVYNYAPDGTAYVARTISQTFTRNEANVAVTASMLRKSDSTTMHSTPGPIHRQIWADGSPPRLDVYGCAAAAGDQVVALLVEQFAVVRKVVKIKSKAIQTATGLYDNEWDFEKKFKTTDEKMIVVVELPPSCDRNRFRITIVRKDERVDLAEKEFTWTTKYRTFGYNFSPKDIAAKGGGPGDYVVKFYSGPTMVMDRKFKIVAPR
jgi:hypothetical protein